MSLLDRAVETVEGWSCERNRDRARCIRLLKQIVKGLERGIDVWAAFLEKAPETGDRFTVVLWMGAKRAKKLHALYLENKDTAQALTELTGVRFKDSLSLVDELDVVQPYEQLGRDETGRERAIAAMDAMSERKAKVETAIARLGG